MQNSHADLRKEEIVNACEKLYEKHSFKDITIKLIGEEITVSRTSIYNYFETKEEIFLALLQKEYEKWIVELNKMCLKYETLSPDMFAKELAHTIERRGKLLKLLSMNMYDLEENSRLERLIEFKKSYGEAIRAVRECLCKFFPMMKEKDIQEFLFSFFPLMFGLYPYSVVTDKQKMAMDEAKVPYEYYSLYELAYNGIKKILGVKE